MYGRVIVYHSRHCGNTYTCLLGNLSDCYCIRTHNISCCLRFPQDLVLERAARMESFLPWQPDPQEGRPETHALTRPAPAFMYMTAMEKAAISRSSSPSAPQHRPAPELQPATWLDSRLRRQHVQDTQDTA